MKTLLIYATYSGSTLEVSNFIAGQFIQKKIHITIKDARDIEPEIYKNYDLILLGSPTWGEGEAHELFKRLFEKSENKKFPQKKFAVFGLGDTSYQIFCGAADSLEEYVQKIEGKIIIETLKINNFYFNQNEELPKITSWVKKMLASISKRS
jgi:flavodoxin I